MPKLTLTQINAITNLANFLYSFLPGSGHEKWKGHITFKTIAIKLGLGNFLLQGNKLTMIKELLINTLEQKPNLFEKLMLEIVKEAIIYRNKQGKSLKPEDIDALNGYILALGFKFPDLWEPELRNSLELKNAQQAKEIFDQAKKEQELKNYRQMDRLKIIYELREAYINLAREVDRQKAGRDLEKLLNRLFEINDLK